MIIRRRLVVVTILCLVALAACGGKKKVAAATPTTTTSTTAAAAPPATGGGAPLTGLPGDPAKLARPALIVKIDNAPNGRPQAGLQQADIVVEEGVEGGITRFATVFHSQDADEVGPVRSARSTDIIFSTSLNHPLFAYSGANAAFQALVAKAPIVDVGASANPGAFFRKSGRPAPYNLFAHFAGLYAKAPAGAGPPPPLFTYRATGEASAGDPATGIAFAFKDKVTTAVSYKWDAAGGGWQRTENGTPHTTADGAQLAPKNVVMEFVNYHDTGFRDRSNTVVPEADLVGDGEAWILSDGKVVKGRWKKADQAANTQFVDAAGAAMKLTPGQTFIELAKPGTATLS